MSDFQPSSIRLRNLGNDSEVVTTTYAILRGLLEDAAIGKPTKTESELITRTLIQKVCGKDNSGKCTEI